MNKKTGRVFLDDSFLDYFKKPEELLAFFTEFRASLHFVSLHHPEMIKFNMFEDEFTNTHLTFLKENYKRVFVNVKIKEKNGGEREVNIFMKIFDYFKNEDDFIFLMNNAL